MEIRPGGRSIGGFQKSRSELKKKRSPVMAVRLTVFKQNFTFPELKCNANSEYNVVRFDHPRIRILTGFAGEQKKTLA